MSLITVTSFGDIIQSFSFFTSLIFLLFFLYLSVSPFFLCCCERKCPQCGTNKGRPHRLKDYLMTLKMTLWHPPTPHPSIFSIWVFWEEISPLWYKWINLILPHLLLHRTLTQKLAQRKRRKYSWQANKWMKLNPFICCNPHVYTCSFQPQTDWSSFNLHMIEVHSACDSWLRCQDGSGSSAWMIPGDRSVRVCHLATGQTCQTLFLSSVWLADIYHSLRSSLSWGPAGTQRPAPRYNVSKLSTSR